MSSIHGKAYGKNLALCAAVVLWVLGIAGSAHAEIIGVSWAGNVYSIDETTGSGFLLGASGYDRLNSLAADSSGIIYSASSNALLTIDPITGSGTFVAPISTSNGVRGLAFSPDDVLFAVVDRGSPGSIGPDSIYTIDVTTGQLTLIGSTGYYGFQGLAFAPDGTLYGWEGGHGGGYGIGLVTVDPLTGIVTDVNPSVGGSLGEGQTLDFSFDGDGTLYMASSWLYTVDINTGISTLVGGGGYSDIRGLAFLGKEIAAVTYDGDLLLSTDGAPTVDAYVVATLWDDEGYVVELDDEEVTFTLTAEGIGTIVVTAYSELGVASALEPLEPGIYMIEVTVTSSAVTTSAVLVVYNPLGGFATGGGWIMPEDDGLNTYPNQRANFGFNAKYKSGATAGHIEFRDSDGYIDLKSTSIEQLVITGGKIAQFKGYASVNGEDGNWFFVKAIDNGEPGTGADTFDIKIWMPGADPEGDPTERVGGVLAGGNILVHIKN